VYFETLTAPLDLIAALSLPSPNFVWSILQMVIGIGLVIFVHELGHFLAAKACGVKCEKFYVGFDAFDIPLGVVRIPSRLAYFQWGETEYGIGILPLGGYVKMLGQHDNPMEAVTDPHAANAAVRLAEDGPRVDAQPDARPAIDPRSYQAKTVPQRMLIMSAGVLMNLVFAVIFASFAFHFGVSYQPALVGDTVGGSPAWEYNLSGSQVLEINGHSTQDRYFPFEEVAQTVMVGGADQDVTVEIKRLGSEGQTERLSLRPIVGLVKMKGFHPPTIGISPMMSTRLGSKNPTPAGQPAAEAGFEPNDLIIKINGQPVNNRVDLGVELVKFWDQPIAVTVLRGTKNVYFSHQAYVASGDVDGQLVELNVAPNSYRETGMVMRSGPIAAVQIGSPAYQQGVKAGDRVLALDGQPFDPLLAAQYLRRKAREEQAVELSLERTTEGQTETLAIRVTPRFPTTVSTIAENMPIALDELGIAVPVTTEIERVVEGSVAAEQGLMPGDRVIAVTMDFRDEQARDKYLEVAKIKTIEGESLEKNWVALNESLQASPPSAFWQLKVQRGDQTLEFEVQPVASTQYFSEKRGLLLQPLNEIYLAADPADALRCGWQQVQYDSNKILRILRQMVTGNVPMTAIGGVGTIAVGATSEAMSGTPRLLMFLTLLSVNLAILNFLPIPILDGGHMVFLAWEGVTGAPPNERVQEGLTMIGALLLLGLIIFALGLDVWRISGLL